MIYEVVVVLSACHKNVTGKKGRFKECISSIQITRGMWYCDMQELQRSNALSVYFVSLMVASHTDLEAILECLIIFVYVTPPENKPNDVMCFCTRLCNCS